MPLSDMNGAGSFWKGAWTVRFYWGAFAVLLLLGAHLLWRRGTEIRLRPRIAQARRRLTGAPGLVALGALAVFAGTGAYAFYNINVLNEYRWPLAGLARTAAFEKKYWRYHDLPQPEVANMTISIDLYPEERRAVTKGRYVLRNNTPQPISDVHIRLLDDDLKLISSDVNGGHLIVDDKEYGYRTYRLDSPMQPGENRVMNFETLRWHRGFRNGPPNTRLVENGTFLSNYELTPVVASIDRESILNDPTARRHYGLPELGGRAKLEVSRRRQRLRPWEDRQRRTSASIDNRRPDADRTRPKNLRHRERRQTHRTLRFGGTDSPGILGSVGSLCSEASPARRRRFRRLLLSRTPVERRAHAQRTGSIA